MYPARLVHDKETVVDLFPNFNRVIRRSRHVILTNQDGYSSNGESSDGECSRSVRSVSSVEMRDESDTALKDLVPSASDLPMSQPQQLPSIFTVDNLLQGQAA